MKVWVLEDFVGGGISVYSEDTVITDIPFVATELGYLEGGYDDEREDFMDDLRRAVDRGRGSATIEERLSVALVEVQ